MFVRSGIVWFRCCFYFWNKKDWYADRIQTKNAKKDNTDLYLIHLTNMASYKPILIQRPLNDTIGIISYSLVRNACPLVSPLSMESKTLSYNFRPG